MKEMKKNKNKNKSKRKLGNQLNNNKMIYVSRRGNLIK
jgi:hypothetical protein